MDPNKIDQFKQAAIGMGYDPNEVEGFTKMAALATPKNGTSDTDITNYTNAVTNGLPWTDVPEKYKAVVFNKLQGSGFNLPKEPTAMTPDEKIAYDVKRQNALNDSNLNYDIKKKSALDKITQTGEDPLKAVFKLGGADLITAKDKDGRYSQAQAIMESGGPESWRKVAPIDQLFNTKQIQADTDTTDLLRKVDYAQQYFTPGMKDQSGGGLTGPIFGKFFSSGLLDRRSPQAVEAQAAISEFSSEKMHQLSGAAVSPTEAVRLNNFLPSREDRESTVALKLDALKRGIQMNQMTRELAVRNGISEGQAYAKFKPLLYEKFGFDKNGKDPALSGGITNNKSLPDKPGNTPGDDVDNFLKSF